LYPSSLTAVSIGVFFGERFLLFGEFFFSNWGINVFENFVFVEP